jgi:hypothetical protein
MLALGNRRVKLLLHQLHRTPLGTRCFGPFSQECPESIDNLFPGGVVELVELVELGK